MNYSIYSSRQFRKPAFLNLSEWLEISSAKSTWNTS